MITEFNDYRDLPFSENIQNELFKRHSHAIIEYGINEEQIVYTEKDVLILMQILEQELRDK